MNYLLVPIITSILISVFFALAQRKAEKLEAGMDAGDFVVRLPKTGPILAAIVTMFFLFVFVFVVDKDAESNSREDVLFVLAGFSPFLLFGPFMILLWYRWKIIVRGGQISVTSFFGREKTFLFGDITAVKRGMVSTRGGTLDCIRAYQGKKKLFSLTAVNPGFHVLASRLESEGVPIEHIGMFPFWG